MTRIVAFSPAFALLAMLATGCQTNTNSENGALFGGATGALLGGIVGHQLHNTAAGAVIGAARALSPAPSSATRSMNPKPAIVL